MDTREPSTGKPQEPKKPEPIEELPSHGATLWRETQRLEAKLNEVIRAVNWLLSQKHGGA
jgi:hypothetical protein